VEITNLRWLGPKPTRQAFDEEKLIYELQLLDENLSVVSPSLKWRQAAARAQTTLLRFDVPGFFNGRLFECRLTISASETRQPDWKKDFEQKLRLLCRAYRDAHPSS
jgi:hypothetical protein